MYSVIINATAIKTSGALTILKDCMDYLESLSQISIEYHLFTVVNDFATSKRIRVHKIVYQNWLARIMWDNGGLQEWCVLHDLQPDLIVSLQNTSTKYITNTGELISQLVYYHQPLPLISYKWNVFNTQELILFLYAHFYSFFVTRNNKSSYYVVQLPYIRELFLNKFKKIDRDKVFVIRPNDTITDIDGISRISLSQELFYFFYPATALKYKNHKIIVQALALLRKVFSPELNNIRVIFTVDKLEPKLMNLIMKNDLLKIIQFIGQKSYNEVLSYYKSVDALLFPSQIETFGLPLTEASCFGLPVIVADLPYAEEVLARYDNKILIDPDSIDLWASAIRNYWLYKKVSPLPCAKHRNSWSVFFELVNKIVKDAH
jgi:glycosyltransferase involved in cell wall biosynthesis